MTPVMTGFRLNNCLKYSSQVHSSLLLIAGVPHEQAIYDLIDVLKLQQLELLLPDDDIRPDCRRRREGRHVHLTQKSSRIGHPAGDRLRCRDRDLYEGI